MKIIDISGPITNNMWSYGPPFPEVCIKEVKGHTEGFGDFSFSKFEGLHSLCGTYLETPAHFFGYDNSCLIHEVPLNKLVNIDCVVLNVNLNKTDERGVSYLDLDDLKACEKSKYIKTGDAILVGKSWGNAKWFSTDHYKNSPYFTYDAFMWLLDQNPCIIGSDTSAWDNFSNPSGFFEKFYSKNILMLAGCINLDQVTKDRTKLTVLPLKIEKSCAAPCRAIIIEE